MDAQEVSGFWSYVHADNSGDAGRIIDLAHDVQDQYGLLTGGELKLFLDRDALDWGDRWREKVNDALGAATFFIPILTPRFFNSTECRRELILFAREAQRLGVSSLVLPILYSRVLELQGDDSSDEAIELLRPLQYEDWSDTRLEDRSSPAYRKGVVRLAERLAEAVVAVSSVGVIGEERHEVGAPLEADDSPGPLELMVEAEDAMPRWQAVVEALGPALEHLTERVAAATADITTAEGSGAESAKSRLLAATRLAGQMRDPTDEILRLGDQNSAEVRVIDAALTAMFDEIERTVPSSAGERAELLGAIGVFEGLAQQAAGATKALEGLSVLVGETARVTRVLRPIARDLQRGLRGFVDAQALYDEWSRRAATIQGRFAEVPPEAQNESALD